MNTDRPTPETDAFWNRVQPPQASFDDCRDHARRLERERDEARRELVELRAHDDRVNEANDRLTVELESLRRDKARLDWIFAVLNVVGTRGFSDRVSWRFPGIDRAAIDAAMKEGTSCVSTATV